MYGRKDNPALWIDNIITIMPAGPLVFPTFYFHDRKPRRYINLTVTYPVSGNGFLGFFESSLDEMNWWYVSSQVSFTGGPAPQVFQLNNQTPLLMLNFVCSNNTGSSSQFSIMVDGIH